VNIGRYAVIRELGRGGMGIVYKAKDSRDGRIVAIKTITTREIRNPLQRIVLVREAGVTARLIHPNIVSVYDVGHHKGLLFVVMEYLEGCPLHRLIDENQPLTLNERLEIAAQLCDALAYANEQGVVHRDVKDANTFVLPDLTVKVLDFGIAAFCQVASPSGRPGTLPYMSPNRSVAK